MEPERLRRISQDLKARRPSQDEAPIAHALIHGFASPNATTGLLARRRVRCQSEQARDGETIRTPKPKEKGKRRARRFLNEMLLRRTAEELSCDPLDDDELEDLFAVESSSHFQRLLSNPDSLAKWDAFNAAPEDEQERKLRRNKTPRRDAVNSHEPSICFTRIDKRIRALFNSRYDVVMPILSELEPQISHVPSTSGSRLELELASNFHRLLGHGVAQYYGLKSHSEDRELCRVTVVAAHSASSCKYAAPSASLVEYLGGLRLHNRAAV